MQDKPKAHLIDAQNETNHKLRLIFDKLCCIASGQTPSVYTASLAADTDIIAAVPGKQIKVISYALLTSSTAGVTVTFKSGGTSGTALWTMPLRAITDTVMGANLANDQGIFATLVGEKLTADFSAAESVTVNISYVLV